MTREISEDGIAYTYVTVKLDRAAGTAEITVAAPDAAPPTTVEEIQAVGVDFWPLAIARELDDAILHMRTNEDEIGTWVLRTTGNADHVQAADEALLANADHWLVRKITAYLKRSLKRIDVSSRSIIVLAEPGFCFTGTLLKLLLATDRSYMLDGSFEGAKEEAFLRATGMNFGPLPMCNDLSRLATRFLGDDGAQADVQAEIGQNLDAQAADDLGLVTFTPGDIDWEDEVRLAIEERASFSPDALTGMEASLRFVGPETMETKIFARLSAWQNWIFQRPNAVGETGALKLYDTGKQAKYDPKRV